MKLVLLCPVERAPGLVPTAQGPPATLLSRTTRSSPSGHPTHGWSGIGLPPRVLPRLHPRTVRASCRLGGQPGHGVCEFVGCHPSSEATTLARSMAARPASTSPRQHKGRAERHKRSAFRPPRAPAASATASACSASATPAEGVTANLPQEPTEPGQHQRPSRGGRFLPERDELPFRTPAAHRVACTVDCPYWPSRS